jgi:CPA2 family monovalent cation:H+ antiporter-2
VSGGCEIIIAGFGVPGRLVAEALKAQHRSFCVIEMNPRTVNSCTAGGLNMLAGDARDPEVLRQAGIESARMLIIAVPIDESALQILQAAKQVHPSIRVVVRCNFTSTGMQALQLGATEVVIAEQIVGERLVQALSHATHSHS